MSRKKIYLFSVEMMEEPMPIIARDFKLALKYFFKAFGVPEEYHRYYKKVYNAEDNDAEIYLMDVEYLKRKKNYIHMSYTMFVNDFTRNKDNYIW